MQKHLKQATAVMLTLLMLLLMIPLTAFAAEATPDSAGTASGTTYQCTWTVENGVLTISGNGEMENYNYPSFEPWKGLDFSRTVIEQGVKNIGWNAFYECKNLSGVSIADSVEVIDIHAFSNCVSLSDITIPDSVTKIEEGAFFNCKSLTSIDIPDNVTYIGDSAFENCDNFICCYDRQRCHEHQ